MSKKKNPYKRCKYLDDLNIPITEYGTNFIDCYKDKRRRKWRKQRTKYGFDERETWNLDTRFIEWIYTRFKMYKKIACVNLTFHKFEYLGKEITQGEAIDIILQACKDYLKTDFLDREMISADVGKLLIEIMPAMWW